MSVFNCFFFCRIWLTELKQAIFIFFTSNILRYKGYLQLMFFNFMNVDKLFDGSNIVTEIVQYPIPALFAPRFVTSYYSHSIYHVDNHFN